MSNLLLDSLESLGEYQRLIKAVRGGHGPASVFGLSETQKCHIIAALSQGISSVMLLVTYNDMQASKIVDDLTFFVGDQVALFPAREISFYQIAAHSTDITAQRLKVIEDILKGQTRFVVASIEALQSRLVPVDTFIKSIQKFVVGQVIPLNELIAWLVSAGYERVDVVEGKGQCSIRGGIVDIYPMTVEHGYRFEFFDDEIDSIREFDAASQRSIQKVKEVEILPVLEVPLDSEHRVSGILRLEEHIHSRLRKTKGKEGEKEARKLAERIRERIDILKEDRYFEGFETYLPFFFDTQNTILDYLDASTLIFLDEPPRIRERAINIDLEFEESYKGLLEKGEILPLQAEMLVSYDTFLHQCLQHTIVTFQMLARAVVDIKPQGIYHFTTRSMHSFHGQMEMLIEELKSWKSKGYRTVILTGTRSRGQRLVQTLEDYDLPVVFSETQERQMQPGEILILAGTLNKGFEYPDMKFALICDEEIFGVQKKKTRVKGKKIGEKIAFFTDLKVGDYIVHENHGIGIYTGIEKLVVEGKSRDYLLIRYGGGDKLYVPTDQMSLIQRYIGMGEKEPKLTKMGGAEWQRAKSKVKESIKEMADDLIKLYATRYAVKGYAFGKDTPWQRQFEDNFEYEETPDQLQCIEEIKKDMETDKPMDRLLCGDVGYGKTEVAIRGAFKAVMDGKQVAILVPTTILAQQHYNTILQRFADFAITTDVLSRFKSSSEQKTILKNLKEGKIDIVVGTHRLLGKDVGFKDLGLLIIDEEQRFGVAHKETLKGLKKNVDVLTLTATPIPRTLHMSMVGIRDMSIIDNPPEERYPVQTYVVEYQESLIRDAIVRELQRGGQVYFVYNRVRSIDRFAEMLKVLVPEARIVIGHGQINENRLEDVMMDFYDREYDVLLCTTIIETGLDIPNVNTIIIYDADRFGLSQLYQLRGRVGRSNRLAYAYLTYRKDKILSEVAEKRLFAIKEFTEFGSGFKIAMRDLEIRGAGNILGAEQHGQMSAVGYDLYCKLLEETIRSMKGEIFQEKVETIIDIRMDAYIPQHYIQDEGQKIEIYKKIAGIRSRNDRDDVDEEIEDRFGDVPPSVRNLILVAYLKVLATTLHIGTISQRREEMIMRFREGAKLDPLVLLKVLNEYRNQITLSATQPTYLTWKWKDAMIEKMVQEAIVFFEKIIDLQN